MNTGEPSSRQDSENRAEAKPPIRLFLQVPEAEASVQPPSRLARFFALNVYSSCLLTNRARREMNLAAILLLIVSCFELAMWTALFNFIYNSSVFYRGPEVAFAVLTAALFALVILYFERQMIVHDDVSQGRANKAMAVRFIYILTAAFITSQPFDLIIFDEPIRTRIYEEAIRREALTKLSNLEQMETELKTLSEAALADRQDGTAKIPAAAAARVQTMSERQALLESMQNLLLVQQRLSGYQASLAGMRQRLREVQSELSLITRSRAPEERRARTSRLEGERTRLLARIGQLQANVSMAQIELSGAEDGKNEALADLSKKKEERDKLLKTINHEIEKYRARLTEWVQLLKGSKSGDKVQDREGWSLEDKENYDFLKKLQVFYDLFAGRSPRWEGGTPAAVARLRNQFNLYDPQPCDGRVSTAAMPCDSEEWGRRKSETWIFRVIWLIGILVAIFIPFLILTIKRYLFPEDLRIFYSRLHQAQAGEPEASLVTRVDEHVLRVGQARRK